MSQFRNLILIELYYLLYNSHPNFTNCLGTVLIAYFFGSRIAQCIQLSCLFSFRLVWNTSSFVTDIFKEYGLVVLRMSSIQIWLLISFRLCLLFFSSRQDYHRHDVLSLPHIRGKDISRSITADVNWSFGEGGGLSVHEHALSLLPNIHCMFI